MKPSCRIIVDCGTTNTRALLIDGQNQILAKESREIGVRDTAITGTNERLKEAVRQCTAGLLAQSGRTFADVRDILASGMITSNVGLAEIPHLTVPAGKRDLAQGMQKILLSDIAPIPIRFIPGIKNAPASVDAEHFEEMDIMRGEEVEAIAVLEHRKTAGPALIILPGSHTKFVQADETNRITGILTTLSGELLSCVTHHTILADAVQRQFVSEDGYDQTFLLKGFRTARQCGIGRACFSGRILNQFVTQDPQKIASYLLGAVLQNDLLALKGSGAVSVSPKTHVIAAGKNPLRKALTALLAEDGYFETIEEFDNPSLLPLSAQGILLTADFYQTQKGQ